MPSRSSRRRRHKKQAGLSSLSPELLRSKAARLLAEWKFEAGRRAESLAAPAAWSLVPPAIEATAQASDPAGELIVELRLLMRPTRIATTATRPRPEPHCKT